MPVKARTRTPAAAPSAEGEGPHDEVEVQVRLPRKALTYQPPPPDLVTQHNALDAIGLKPRQFLEFIRTAPLPVVKIGRTRGVRREAFLAHLETLVDDPGAPAPAGDRETSLAKLLGLEAG